MALHLARSRLSAAGNTESMRALSDAIEIVTGMAIVACSAGGSGVATVGSPNGEGTSKCFAQPESRRIAAARRTIRSFERFDVPAFRLPNHDSSALAEPNPSISIALTPAAHDHFVAVLKKRPG